MSVMRCPHHDRNYDTDYDIVCPDCEYDETLFTQDDWVDWQTTPMTVLSVLINEGINIESDFEVRTRLFEAAIWIT